jgi:hypothetical protein
MTTDPRPGIDADYPVDDRRNDDRGGSELPPRSGHEERPTAESALHREQTGPTGRATATEAGGDPDRVTIESGAEAGAGAGAVAGVALGGPVGGAVGAVAGAAIGTAAEAADTDVETNEERPLAGPASAGTGFVDPATDYVRN